MMLGKYFTTQELRSSEYEGTSEWPQNVACMFSYLGRSHVCTHPYIRLPQVPHQPQLMTAPS